MAQQIAIPIVAKDNYSSAVNKATNAVEKLNNSSSKGLDKLNKNVSSLPLKFLTLEKAIQGARAGFTFLTDSVSLFEKMSGQASTGGMAKLQQQFGQLQVEVGSVLEPMFKNLSGWIEKNWEGIRIWATNIAGTIPNIVGLFVNMGKAISASFNTIVAGVSTALTSIAFAIVYGVNSIISSLPDFIVPDTWVKNVSDFEDTMKLLVKTSALATKQSALDVAEASKGIAKNTVELFKQVTNSQQQHVATGLKFKTDAQKKEEEEAKKLAEELEALEWEKFGSVVKATNARTKHIIDTRKRIRDILKADQEQEIADISAQDEKKIRLAERNAEKELALQKDRQETAISMTFQYSQMLTQIASTATQTKLNTISYEAQQEQQQITDLFEARSKNVKDTKKLEELKNKALLKLAEDTRKKEKEAREKQKKWTIASILISGGEAVMSAWASAMKLSYPANIIAGIAASGIITGVTIAQVAQVAKQKFAGGGEVKGTGKADTVPIMATPGEWMLNERQKSRLYNVVFGGAVPQNNVTMGGDTFNISGPVDNNAINKIRQVKQKRLDQLRSDFKELRYLGQLPIVA